jgi:hypothetical protein
MGGVGCAPANPSGSAEVVECRWNEPPADPFEPSPEVSESQIFLDLSRTMSGFISDGRGGMPVTLQQDLLRTILLESLGNVAVTPPTLWGFGREVFPLEGSLSSYAAREGRGAADPQGLYDQAETDVVGALLAASRQPAALSVILTDNAQDLRTPKDRRAPGFDRSALVRTLTEELAGHGFGVWLVGFRNEFRGAYFSILLAANGEGVHVNKPILLASEQPLYAWVVSRDLVKGRAVVDHLVRELRGRWRVRHGEGEAPVHAVELAPGTPPRVIPAEPTPDELEVAAGDPAFGGLDPSRERMRVRQWAPPDGVPPLTAATLVYSRPREANLFFLLKARLDPNTEQPQAWGEWPLSAWRLRWESDSGRGGPGVQLATDLTPFAVRDGAGQRFRKLVVPYNQVAQHNPEDRWAQLPLWVALDPQAIPEDHWLEAWSTNDDTTREGIEGKSLYLFDVTRSVLEQTVGRRRPAACIHLTLVEEG